VSYNNYLETTKQLKKRYRKGTGVLKESRLGNINKEGSLKNKLPKGDPRGAITKLLGVISLVEGELVLLLPSLDKPY